ncbi:MAG: ACP S-malonyltransferase [Planctomycetaceae bacterium]|nr:ACP S-malonyltransferase [Planctomycetaceae bacterium]
MAQLWTQRVATTTLAFRGFNLTNLGKTPQLLAHPAYGPIVERHLKLAGSVFADAMHRPLDLVERVRAGRESTLDTFAEDIALIIAVEMAQLELLDQFFGLDYRGTKFTVGYSLGELTALVAGGTFVVEQVLPPLFQLAGDCADLARDASMGILFSRGPELNLEAVHRLCIEINQDGRGVIAVSSYLSPNTVLLIGQRDTLARFKDRMHSALGTRINLRKADGAWPPLHTPLLWERNVPCRAGLAMHSMGGGLQAPLPNVFSLVTGRFSYDSFNARETIVDWLQRPQRLWDGVCEILGSGAETVVHVGPDPNLIPATFKRLSDNVRAQTTGRSFNSWGKQAVSLIARRAWLAPVLSTRVGLMRAPFIEHIILEDWLLAQDVR